MWEESLGFVFSLGVETWICCFFWCKAKLFWGGTEQFNPSLELEFVVFCGVKQSYLGETASSIPAFFLTLKLGALVQEHIYHLIVEHVSIHDTLFSNFFSWLCILNFSHNSFLKELLSSHKRKPCVLGPQCTSTHQPTIPLDVCYYSVLDEPQLS
jgi:hypothetical protein